jgi:hypothetical protein
VRQGQLPPELIMEVADKVYGLLLEELRIERERLHLLCGPVHGRGGGQ